MERRWREGKEEGQVGGGWEERRKEGRKMDIKVNGWKEVREGRKDDRAGRGRG